MQRFLWLGMPLAAALLALTLLLAGLFPPAAWGSGFLLLLVLIFVVHFF